ncbi:MAG TPA: PilZ domain-containing protein [Sphingomicrobium sp.]|nr:PilZ domain-containing protein [Sphingomicrobium sp.]
MAFPKAAAHDPDPHADRRAYRRVPVALPASLQADGERHSVQLLDVSAGGAKLGCAAILAVGTAVTLDCGGLAASAEVRWQNGGIMGVKFDMELDERVVAALADRSSALEALMQTRE